MELVSVIIPVYNVGRFLDRCLESVCSQTYKALEIILVDDGSKDRSGEKCDFWARKDGRIRVIHKANGGLSSARNAGLRAAKGEFIYFLDSDDSIEPELIEHTVNAIEGYDLVSFNYRVVDEQGNVMMHTDYYNGAIHWSNEKEQFEFLFMTFLSYRVGWAAWNRLFRKSVIDKYDLYFEDNNRIFAEDLYFSLLYLIHSRAVNCLEGEYYNYLLRADSIMGIQKNRYNLGRMTELVKTVEQHLDEQEGFVLLKTNYSVVFFGCIYSLVEKIKNLHPEYDIIAMRQIICTDVEDLPYFMKQSADLLHHGADLKKRFGLIHSREILSEFKYYIDGNLSAYRFRQSGIRLMKSVRKLLVRA